jgi:integrase
MNYVQPIRDIEKVNEMKAYLKSKSERNYILFLLGISTGLRISDILQLKKEDLLNTHINIKETKTKKHKRIRIPPNARRELMDYARRLKDGQFIIRSRQGGNRPIDRSSAYRILREAAEQANLKEIGTHTLRKTFGYHFYHQTKDIAMLQELFNHSSQDITLRYIGINQDSLDKAMLKFKI